MDRAFLSLLGAYSLTVAGSFEVDVRIGPVHAFTNVTSLTCTFVHRTFANDRKISSQSFSE